MRIAICDDDERELSRLSELMTEYRLSRGREVDCRFFQNGTDFLCSIKGGEYDLVLLDVLMPGVSGIQAARELRERDKNVKLIFLSSSPEFAIESYSVGAYHYLLKPADADSLFSMLDKAAGELSRQDGQGLLLKSREGIIRVSFTALEYVEVINKTVFFHMADGVFHEVTATLADFEERLLSRPEFLKTHRSYLVNLSCIQAIGTNGIVTKNGHSIPLSRQRRSQVQDAYIHFQQEAVPADFSPEVQQTASFEKKERSDGMWRILLVDDEPADRMFWADILRHHGCLVELAANGEEALKMVSEVPCDCVLLDVMLSDGNGISLCEELRKLTQAPVIFLSCLTDTDKQVAGFAAGGTDYITKDTPAELFWAKVETRMKQTASERTVLQYGPLILDLAACRTVIDEKEVMLTPIEFNLLWRLAENAGHVFSPEEIFDTVWGGQTWDGGQTVQLHMSRLRRKLEKACAKHHFIETVWGQGYRFVPAKLN